MRNYKSVLIFLEGPILNDLNVLKGYNSIARVDLKWRKKRN